MPAATSPLTVTAHPAAARPGVSAALVAYFALMGLLAGPWLMGAPLLSWTGALGALIVFDAFVLAMARWFFPTRYVFENDGIRVRFVGTDRFYAYRRFRSCKRTRAGLYLSPRTDPTRFDRFRGLHVLSCDPPVMEVIEGKLAAQAASVEGKGAGT